MLKKYSDLNDNKYQSILENMYEAYFELDLSGKFTFFNRAALEMLGYTAKEMMNMSYHQYVSPETAITLFDIFNNVYRTGNHKKTITYEVITKDGNKKYRETSISLIRDSKEKPIGFSCIARDITEQILANEALKQRDQELVIKSQFLTESNTALKVLLKSRENDKQELERIVISNITQLVIHYVEELKKTQLTAKQLLYIETIENNLNDIVSPFLRNLTLKDFNLTPKELQVAHLVKEGKTTKQISDILNTSIVAIDFHRNNIRKKMGINKKKTNLRSHLLSLT